MRPLQASKAVADQGTLFNPQQQFLVSWPAVRVVALAYVDQLERANALSSPILADLTAALDRSSVALERGRRDVDLADRLESLSGELAGVSGVDITVERSAALAETLLGIAAALR